MSAKDTVAAILGPADVILNGTRPWDLRVHNEGFYRRVLANASLGIGESYMDGWWDAEKLDELFLHVAQARLEQTVPRDPKMIATIIAAKLLNRQSRKKAWEVGERHYDTSNRLFEAMLDKRLTYTCGYWSDPAHPAKDLDAAQEAKLDLVCRKLNLQKGQMVLDIGCGWGSFAKYAAERYGAAVTGVTVSKEQAELARELCKGLPVTIELKDYRDITGTFDHVISLGMFEHVGYKNYKTYMKVVERCLKDDGLFLLHTIGSNISREWTDPWVSKYIFPNGMLPSIKQIGAATEHRFVMEDWHNFGADYDKTLMAWFHNFDRHWPSLKNEFNERFYRMWKFYLLVSAGAFRAREMQLWQIIFSKNGVPGGYRSVR